LTIDPLKTDKNAKNESPKKKESLSQKEIEDLINKKMEFE
jgi:hypothetical protein